jgi:hypothetical protein
MDHSDVGCLGSPHGEVIKANAAEVWFGDFGHA